MSVNCSKLLRFLISFLKWFCRRIDFTQTNPFIIYKNDHTYKTKCSIISSCFIFFALIPIAIRHFIQQWYNGIPSVVRRVNTIDDQKALKLNAKMNGIAICAPGTNLNTPVQRIYEINAYFKTKYQQNNTKDKLETIPYSIKLEECNISEWNYTQRQKIFASNVQLYQCLCINQKQISQISLAGRHSSKNFTYLVVEANFCKNEDCANDQLKDLYFKQYKKWQVNVYYRNTIFDPTKSSEKQKYYSYIQDNIYFQKSNQRKQCLRYNVELTNNLVQYDNNRWFFPFNFIDLSTNKTILLSQKNPQILSYSCDDDKLGKVNFRVNQIEYIYTLTDQSLLHILQLFGGITGIIFVTNLFLEYVNSNCFKIQIYQRLFSNRTKNNEGKYQNEMSQIIQQPQSSHADLNQNNNQIRNYNNLINQNHNQNNKQQQQLQQNKQSCYSDYASFKIIKCCYNNFCTHTSGFGKRWNYLLSCKCCTCISKQWRQNCIKNYCTQICNCYFDLMLCTGEPVEIEEEQIDKFLSVQNQMIDRIRMHRREYLEEPSSFKIQQQNKFLHQIVKQYYEEKKRIDT